MRTILGMTQVQLARLVGVHPLTLSSWERTKNRHVPTAHQRALMQLLIDDPTVRERLGRLIAEMEWEP